MEMAKDSRVLEDPAPAAVVAALNENSVTLSLGVWTKTGDMGAVSSQFNVEARDRLKEAGISVAQSQRVIRMVQE
jgi:small conductance mechanosensitive channel